MRVAIQGKQGSFHAQAAAEWFGGDVELIECGSFAEVFHKADTRDVDAIVSAVENTIYGSINEVYQLIDETEWPIIGEIKLPIAHQLITLPDAALETITKVFSHPVGLAQCRHSIEKLLPHAEMVEYYDTAAAVDHIKSLDNTQYAAIASEAAADLYELPILQRDMQDNKQNATRFLVLSADASHAAQSPNRASMVLVTNHEPGALVDALGIFAKEGINLVKLQSQPIVGSAWRYKFFIVADCTPEQIEGVIATVQSHGHTLRLLGTYQSSN